MTDDTHYYKDVKVKPVPQLKTKNYQIRDNKGVGQFPPKTIHIQQNGQTHKTRKEDHGNIRASAFYYPVFDFHKLLPTKKNHAQPKGDNLPLKNNSPSLMTTVCGM